MSTWELIVLSLYMFVCLKNPTILTSEGNWVEQVMKINFYFRQIIKVNNNFDQMLDKYKN